MSVKKEANGRRSVQVEFEAPGTPEEVWQAFATGPGISSWFLRTEVEAGDGMTPGSPPMAREWSIEARGGGICIVRVVHSLFASTDDWDNQLESAASGWWFLEHPADLSHALPRPTLRDHAGHDSHREYGGGGLGNADRGVGSERRARRAALDDARGCLTAQRRGGASHRESIRRPAAARQAGAGHSRPWRRHLSQWPERGGDELIHVWRSGGRNRCPRDTGVGGVFPATLP